MAREDWSENKRQRKLKRAKTREDRRKYGWNKKRRDERKAEAAQKRKALAQAAIVGGDAQAGLSKDSSGDYSYDPSSGSSMKSNQSGGGYNAKNSSAAAKQLMRNQKDGGSMYGKKHGASMSGEKYDAKQAYNKNLSAKARLHYLENERHDKTSGGRHSILKHMKKF